MIQKVKRKDSGFVYQILPVLISILVVMCMVVMSGDWMSMINKRDEINQIARTFLLKMEGTGYLLEEDQASLIQLLENMNVSSIDLTGTTVNNVSYGERIYLHIEGVFTYEAIELIPFKEAEYEELSLPFTVEMMSTAKH